MKDYSICWPLPALLLIPAVISAQQQQTTAIDERAVLLEFYQATGGPSWNDNKGWEDSANIVDEAFDDSDYCDWVGVICTGEADLDLMFEHRHLEEVDSTTISTKTGKPRVMGLDLSHNFLQGRTPSSLWQLPLLQYLDVNGNENLQVDFSSVYQAPQLAIVKAMDTATSSLAGLDHASLTLNVLHLTGCPLKSEFPAELLQLTNLRDLQLSNCQLEGQLQGLPQLSNLRNLNLFDNQLKGSLPNEIIQLARLERFSVSRNQLTGDLHTLDAFEDLLELYVAENQFSGPLPSLAALPRLQKAYMNQNLLSGTVPAQFLQGVGEWEPNLREDAGWIVVNLANNRLTGVIPETLDGLEGVSMDFNWRDNKFENVSAALCDNEYWNRGAVSNYGCDGLVCPSGTFNPVGHATNSYTCFDCESAQFYGTSTCVLDNNDKSGLMALYLATNGQNWFNTTGWPTDNLGLTGEPDICDWYGISCYQEGDTDDDGDEKAGRVRVINLSGNNLVGTAPDDIFTMEYLHTLEVARNPNLVVPLTLMRESDEIRHLDISQTDTVDFDGLELASAWFAYLIADGLPLGGTLPKQVLNLTELRLLSMAECELIGPLPADLGMLTKLNELYLYDNHFRGTIPAALGLMTELRYVSLAHNQLEGPLPTTVDSLQKLEAFSLTDQVSKGGGITGPMKTFRFHPFLKSLQLSKNLLEGTVPVQLLEGTESLQTVLKVNLDHNNLSGKVPGELARFQHMDLGLQGNRFTELDERLCANADWMNGLVGEYGCDAILCPVGTGGGRRQFDNAPCAPCSTLEDADGTTTGTRLDWMGQEHCELQFSMDFSDEQGLVEMLFEQTNGDQWKNNQNWGLQKKTTTADSATSEQAHVCDWYGISCDESRSIVGITLGANNLQGTFPTELFMLPKLEKLSLFENPALTIPMDGIDNAESLQQLILDSTGLTTLEGIGKARSLIELNVEDNKLEGELPEELSRLIHIRSLSISKNGFQGSVPYWIKNLPSLETFLAANNQFEGALPDFASLGRLSYVDLSNNFLSGEIPLNFLSSADGLDKLVVDLSNNRIEGTVPRELARLEHLTLHLKNNEISDIDRELCVAGGWNDYDVEKFGCDGILCPAGTSTITGRQTSETAQCSPCKNAKYMGSTACFSTSSSAPQLVSLWTVVTLLASTTSVLVSMM